MCTEFRPHRCVLTGVSEFRPHRCVLSLDHTLDQSTMIGIQSSDTYKQYYSHALAFACSRYLLYLQAGLFQGFYQESLDHTLDQSTMIGIQRSDTYKQFYKNLLYLQARLFQGLYRSQVRRVLWAPGMVLPVCVFDCSKLISSTCYV